ncbi:hypothetical protein BURKHO8Y_110133 [Burkholderia sp. 8Y]|nr:hypothetical protein BURKHO8Y_110133 [Burkholderia sp. 8Y]
MASESEGWSISTDVTRARPDMQTDLYFKQRLTQGGRHDTQVHRLPRVLERQQLHGRAGRRLRRRIDASRRPACGERASASGFAGAKNGTQEVFPRRHAAARKAGRIRSGAVVGVTSHALPGTRG